MADSSQINLGFSMPAAVALCVFLFGDEICQDLLDACVEKVKFMYLGFHYVCCNRLLFMFYFNKNIFMSKLWQIHSRFMK